MSHCLLSSFIYKGIFGQNDTRKHHGAAEARRAHNPEDVRSKRTGAIFSLLSFFIPFLSNSPQVSATRWTKPFTQLRLLLQRWTEMDWYVTTTWFLRKEEVGILQPALCAYG